MYQLVRLGDCIHVFDNQKNRFVKSPATNIAFALGLHVKGLTSKQMINEVQWVRCVDPRCRFRCCGEGSHWIAKIG